MVNIDQIVGKGNYHLSNQKFLTRRVINARPSHKMNCENSFFSLAFPIKQNSRLPGMSSSPAFFARSIFRHLITLMVERCHFHILTLCITVSQIFFFVLIFEVLSQYMILYRPKMQVSLLIQCHKFHDRPYFCFWKFGFSELGSRI